MVMGKAAEDNNNKKVIKWDAREQQKYRNITLLSVPGINLQNPVPSHILHIMISVSIAILEMTISDPRSYIQGVFF